jgi:hypothetical protein
MSGPKLALASVGRPGTSPSAIFCSVPTTSSKRERCTYTRSVPRHTCPLFSKTERVRPAVTAAMSASWKMMAGFFPPSSIDTGLMPLDEARRIAAPVRVSPVKVMASRPACVVSSSPAEPGPKPWTTLYTPWGTPASFITSPRRVAVPGVSSDGLTMTALPQASAGPTFQVISKSGRFHGQTTATTPFGLRFV